MLEIIDFVRECDEDDPVDQHGFAFANLTFKMHEIRDKK
jgi:hypothetical protein